VTDVRHQRRPVTGATAGCPVRYGGRIAEGMRDAEPERADEKRRGIAHADVVDYVAIHPETGLVTLAIDAPGEWDGSPARPGGRRRGGDHRHRTPGAGEAPARLTVLSVAPLLAEAIRRIHEGESVSALFADGAAPDRHARARERPRRPLRAPAHVALPGRLEEGLAEQAGWAPHGRGDRRRRRPR
jgi:hypothetical protein